MATRLKDRDSASCVTLMLLIGSLFGAVIAALLLLRLLRSGNGHGQDLGWMSQQWLAEQRASHQR
jgi:hypothetical protein